MDEKRVELLSAYYNKFCEDNRFDSRHGYLEYVLTMKYIKEYLEQMGKNPSEIKIMDIGAGTGRYSIPLAEEGYDVTAVDLSPNNVGIMKHKSDRVKAFRGNALDLSRFEDEGYDMCLLFGPMYHLCDQEDRIKALLEAKRLLKKDGVLMVAYIMNEYAVLTYGIMEGHIDESVENGTLDDSFHVICRENDLYSFVRLEDIDELNKACGLERIKIFSPDGPANHMRLQVNRLSQKQYELFIKYQESVCERPDLLGASAHTVDILKK